MSLQEPYEVKRYREMIQESQTYRKKRTSKKIANPSVNKVVKYICNNCGFALTYLDHSHCPHCYSANVRGVKLEFS